jgi:hypothetical protein
VGVARQRSAGTWYGDDADEAWAVPGCPPGKKLAVIDLNGPGHYLTWGWFQVSWANLVVVLLMLALFALALVVPFPGHSAADGDDAGEAQR